MVAEREPEARRYAFKVGAGTDFFNKSYILEVKDQRRCGDAAENGVVISLGQKDGFEGKFSQIVSFDVRDRQAICKLLGSDADLAAAAALALVSREIACLMVGDERMGLNKHLRFGGVLCDVVYAQHLLTARTLLSETKRIMRRADT